MTSSVQGGLAIVRLDREHGNAIDDSLLGGLMDAFQRAEADPGVRGVLLAAAGKLFCPGLDLIELVGFDRRAMARFIERFAACMLSLYTFPKPMVAAVGGHALAGGCILALTADLRVVREGALIGLHEIRIGVPLPFGVALILRESVHSTRLHEVALLGRDYSDAEAVATGLAHEIHAAEGFEEHALARLAEFASRDPLAFATTKRYLRAAAVERIRAHDRLFLEEFLDCWFAEGTRRRIGEIVAGLEERRRGG